MIELSHSEKLTRTRLSREQDIAEYFSKFPTKKVDLEAVLLSKPDHGIVFRALRVCWNTVI